jgi:DNA-binding transcriptional MerR regulator
MDKSPDAFRTISEVAEQLETPAHVLRFWESRFPQIKPVKRAGGRRYYRPADVALLGGIRHLLHDEGMTIRGVQKILREQGVRHVAAMAEGGDAVAFDLDADDLAFDGIEPEVLVEGPEEGTVQVFALEQPVRQPTAHLPEGAEIVPLRAVPDQKASPAPPKAMPVRPRPVPVKAVEDVPEAGYIWVEDQPELALEDASSLFPDELFADALFEAPQDPAVEVPFLDLAPADLPVKLSGVAARLRALRHPVTPENAEKLMELHSRLGLLHAQIAEALRLRR